MAKYSTARFWGRGFHLACLTLALLPMACSKPLLVKNNADSVDVEVVELSSPVATGPSSEDDIRLEPERQAGQIPSPAADDETPDQVEVAVSSNPEIAENPAPADFATDTYKTVPPLDTEEPASTAVIPMPVTPPEAPDAPGFVKNSEPRSGGAAPENKPELDSPQALPAASEPVPEKESPPPVTKSEPQVLPKPEQEPAPTEQENPVVPAVEPPAPDLDMDKLGTRLRKTKAIGLFTKLELKSQLEDLLDDLEDYHESKSTLRLEQLEEHFNLLVMKLMVLLQDDDPQLHMEIVQARPALWTTLADPGQFSALKGP